MADTLHLRPVAPADARLLFEWVSDAEVRAQSFSTRAVSWPEHLAWLEHKLAHNAGASRTAWMWMAEAREGRDAGLIRFESEGASAVMSFSVALEFRGRGYGAQLVAAGCRRLFDESELDEIVGYVKPENLRSRRTLARAGLVFRGVANRSGQPAQIWVKTRKDAP